ncbi:MAG TPA: lysophospholipase, partial [Coleofasciculaceae cyanobacterium]
GGGDGTVTVESTKLKYTHFVCLKNVNHVALKTDSAVIKTIQEFWSQPRQPLPKPEHNLISRLIDHFRAVPGITDANASDFAHAKTVFSFSEGVSLRTWKNPVGVKHIFIANQHGTCEYAAFVGWIHADGLRRAIDQAIKHF